MGIKKPFVFGLVLYGLVGGSGLFIKSYWVLIVSRAIFGIAVAAIAISLTVTILNLYKGVERNKIMGWRGTATNFGGIIWPLIGGFLGGFSWHLPFAVYFLGIPLGFFALITMPETRGEKNQDTGSVLKVFRIKPVLFVIYGLLFLTMTLLYTIIVFLPQLLETMGISNPFYISLFLAVAALSAELTSLMYGKIKSRLSYKMIVLIALSLWAVGFTAISQASSGVIIAASVALFGVGQGMLIPATMVWAGETVAIPFRGRIISYLIAFGFIGQFSSTIIFGPVSLSFGLNGVFLMAGGICALLLVFSAAMRK